MVLAVPMALAEPRYYVPGVGDAPTPECDGTATFCFLVWANAEPSCTSGGDCFYYMSGGASGCSPVGGSAWFQSTIGQIHGSFEIPINGCNRGSDGATGKFGDDCHDVEGAMTAVAVVLVGASGACTAPIE